MASVQAGVRIEARTAVMLTPRLELWLYALMTMKMCVVEPVELLALGNFCGRQRQNRSRVGFEQNRPLQVFPGGRKLTCSSG